jgi:hypothetical protein
MINENMKKVLVALRSGELKQTSGSLQDHMGHCCLGVMCEVYEKETGDKLPREADELIGGYLNGDSGKKVKSWVGLECPDTLVLMNDDEGKSFSEIADFIETDPFGLLV